jgi:hypothetical protein
LHHHDYKSFLVIQTKMMNIVGISNDNNNLHDKNEMLNAKSKTTSRTVYRQVGMDPKRHRFHNKAAVYLTVASLVMVAILCVVYGETHNPSSSPSSSFATDGDSTRWLEGNTADDDDDNEDDDTVRDFSDFSCRYLYAQAPRPGEKQCAFARSCNGGDGVWAAWIFCRNTESFTTVRLFWIMMPIMIIWMITLFRLLGSTAEDYFSPSLEMFSTKLGLPPRFAGVSLLALGNGAADVSATVSAMVNDELNGYKLSLGALSGAAMLIGGVVAGIVVLVAEGVPCRGALVRDVSALFVTILLVWQQLAVGEVGPHTVTLFLSMYGLFVILVLAADVYHRRVVIPRLQAAADHLETLRQMEDARIVQEGATAAVGGMSGLPANHLETPPRSTLSRMITSISNYDNPATSALCGPTTLNGEDGTTPVGWGIDSSELEQDRPIVLHGQHGILHGDGTAEASGPDVVVTEPTSPARDGAGSYTLVHDELMDRVCVDVSSPTSFAASSWKGAMIDGKQDIVRHFSEVWEDIAWNGDLHAVEKFLLLCEFPFTVLRKVS